MTQSLARACRLMIATVSVTPLAWLTCCALASAAPESNVYVQLAKKVVPSVVNISTLTTIKQQPYGGGEADPFRRFFEDFQRAATDFYAAAAGLH